MRLLERLFWGKEFSAYFDQADQPKDITTKAASCISTKASISLRCQQFVQITKSCIPTKQQLMINLVLFGLYNLGGLPNTVEEALLKMAFSTLTQLTLHLVNRTSSLRKYKEIIPFLMILAPSAVQATTFEPGQSCANIQSNITAATQGALSGLFSGLGNCYISSIPLSCQDVSIPPFPPSLLSYTTAPVQSYADQISAFNCPTNDTCRTHLDWTQRVLCQMKVGFGLPNLLDIETLKNRTIAWVDANIHLLPCRDHYKEDVIRCLENFFNTLDQRGFSSISDACTSFINTFNLPYNCIENLPSLSCPQNLTSACETSPQDPALTALLAIVVSLFGAGIAFAIIILICRRKKDDASTLQRPLVKDPL